MVVGGKRREGPGDFFEPTLLVDVDHSMECMTEETFGPTLPVMKVADAEEAVRLANDSPYGLQASVWTRDIEKGERLARQVEAGVCCVNDAQINYVALELPMGGWKSSGLGSQARRGGDPQVHQAADDPGHPLGTEARHAHAPLQGEDDEAAGPRDPPALRARQARLTSYRVLRRDAAPAGARAAERLRQRLPAGALAALAGDLAGARVGAGARRGSIRSASRRTAGLRMPRIIARAGARGVSEP